MFKSINPYNQSVIEEFALMTDADLNNKIESASRAYKSWRKESFKTRATLMQAVAALLDLNKEKYALVITTEMGKTIRESRAEIEKCSQLCRFHATHAEQFLTDRSISTEARKSFLQYSPIGAVLAIMPWNFPFWQVFRFTVPTIMAGNVGLLKHAPNVCKTSLLIEEIFIEAGFPEGVFQSLLIDVGKVEGIIQSNVVQAVTLTGSEYAGSQVASLAGKNIKKTVLELGGSDPFIVLEDADFVEAAKVATQSRMRNAGQSCIAAKRFIVLAKAKEEFMFHFKKNIEALTQGNPQDENVTVGPMARIDLAEKIEKQLQDSVAQGAVVIMGGSRSGCNVAPVLLDNVTPGMPAFDEETFGPLAAIITVNTEEDAIATANNSRYGLGASIWTKDLEKGERLAKEIEAGSVFINSLMRSDERLPFGGIKKSGYGRELSDLGIREFTNAKSVYIN